jgi:choline dehydrogenase-like flavoprotein
VIIDLTGLPSSTEVKADVCVIGAGAAGITIAKEFVGHSASVCLIEGGGLEFEADTQALYDGTNSGRPYYDLDVLRLRYFGGTTNHWAGACMPLDEVDFEERPGIPDTGWPIRRPDLDPYYERAHAVCRLGPYDYRVDTWQPDHAKVLRLDGSRITTVIMRVNPVRFGQSYRAELEESSNVTVYLHANVTDLVASTERDRLDRIEATSLGGRKLYVVAKHFVLATGAIENARLLLANDRVRKAGIGNDHDLVGRYFMEHPSVPSAILAPSDLSADYALYIGAESGGRFFRGYLALSADLIRNEGLLNARVRVTQTSLDVLAAKQFEGVRSGGLIFNALAAGRMPANFGKHVANVISDIDDVVIYSYRRGFQPARLAYSFLTELEQAPNASSRVTLVSDRDALGMPKVSLNWSMGELEKRTIRRFNDVLATEFGRSGLGRVRLLEDAADTSSPTLRGSWHQMGTTRMHGDPRKGVVDANCLVHSVSNLYIAGSSVFPTCGYANPTLTIIALAIRLADHLKTQYG